MKKRIRVLCKSLFLFSLTFVFFSCKNFLDAGKVRKEIEQQIYINNHECPVATVEEPAYSDAGVQKNKAIVISFTLPIDPETFTDSFQIVDSSNKSLLEHYTQAKWSDDYKSVTIAANELNLIDLGSDKTKDIFVKLSKECTTKDKLPVKQALNHKFRINDTVDNVPPVIDLVRAELPSAYINKEVPAFEEPPLLLEGEITKDNEAAIIKANHINTMFDLYIEGCDYGGGRVWGLLKYRRLYDSVGNAVNDLEETQLITFDEHTAAGKWYGTTILDLSDNSKYHDGLYQVKVYVKDSSVLCESPKVYNVIRDTTLAYSLNGQMNIISYEYRDINELPENFDPSVTKLVWEAPERQLPEITYNGKTIPSQTYSGPDSIDYYKGNDYQVFAGAPVTAQDIEYWKKWLGFGNIFEDVYYVSPLTKNTYSNSYNDFSYYFSWGTDPNQMTEPVKLELDEDYARIHIGWNYETAYRIPDACLNYCSSNKTKDIYFTATYVDTVGNKNTMTLAYPKIVDCHNYVVEDDNLNTGKKKVTLNYADMSRQAGTNFLQLQDKAVRVIYRVYYGKQEEGKDDSLVPLSRNPSVPWIYDPYSGITDSNVIYGLEPDTKYVVYLQANYATDSLLNNQFSGGLFGSLNKIIIDTGLTGASLEKPEFTYEKQSAGINTGLYDVTVTITNPGENVKYLPAYSINGTDWVYYEAQSLNDQNKFTISVLNPLKMPIGTREEWSNEIWDSTFRTNQWSGVEPDDQGNKTGGWDDDNTYFIAVDNCRNRIGYPDVIAKLKVFAVTQAGIEESAVQDVAFKEEDDNIPPYQNKEITTHDSKLSFDGHSFTFANLVKEDEGHMLEYFDYYYVPYEEMWGNNLNVLSEEQIASLPGGRASFTSSCYLTDEGTRADYNMDMTIPVYGLEDGKYMYFAKVNDSYGNYKYVTLGQAHIGTFKNKLKVDYDVKKNHFISTLPLAADEEKFDRYMISVQRFSYEDKKDDYTWYNHYEWSNELQDCTKTIKDGKTVVSNESGEGFFTQGIENGMEQITSPRELEPYNYYRITIQAFNENSYDSSTGKGADKIYGRPYANKTYTGDDAWKNYDHDVAGWVNNESEYDVCTDETVSNTVVMYIPPSRERDPYWYNEPVMSSFFVDTATPRSNKDYFVEVIASGRDLGDDIDEWERRGKIVKMHEYHTGLMVSGKYILNPDFKEYDDYGNRIPETVDNPKYILNPAYSGHDDYIDNPDYNTFNASVALEDMYNSREKGLVYYVVVAYFADSSRAMSRVFTMNGF